MNCFYHNYVEMTGYQIVVYFLLKLYIDIPDQKIKSEKMLKVFYPTGILLLNFAGLNIFCV